MTADPAQWAKAPDLADRPRARSELAERTDADRREQLEGGMSTVRCRRCEACVLVKKNSSKHLSVQWNPGAVRACEEFAAHADGTRSSALVDTCEQLRDSIDRSVQEGRIAVGGTDRSDERRGGET